MQTYLERVRLINGKIVVKVKPNSQKNEITAIENKTLKINIKAPPENNKANLELIKFLKHLTKKQVKILSGFNQRKKLVEIKD